MLDTKKKWFLEYFCLYTYTLFVKNIVTICLKEGI